MKSFGRAFVVAAAISGCGLTPQPECVGGTCCPAWTVAEGDACKPLRWSSQRTFAAHAVEPQVAVSSSGEVALAWLVVDLEGDRVFAARQGAGFVSRAAPTRPGARLSEPRVAIGPERVDLIWRDVTGTEAIWHGFGQEDWLWDAAPLSFPMRASEGEVVASEDGEVLVVWNQWTGANWNIAVASSTGTAFQRPHDLFDVLSPFANFSNNPDIALNPDGQAAIAWFQDAGDGLMTFVSERAAGSDHFLRPSRADALSVRDADVDNPVVALSQSGELAAAWRQALPDGRFTLFVATKAPGQEWLRPVSLDEGLISPADVVFNVDVGFAGEELFVAFQQRVDEDKGVFIHHRDSDGAWVTPPLAPYRLSDPSVEAFDPSMATGSRGVVVSWTERDPSGESRVMVRRSAAAQQGSESERWGTSTQLSDDGTIAGGSRVAVAPGAVERAACVWTEEGAGRLAFTE